MAKKTKAKKVNRKLRRTVLKTISAILMIMAVIVAAIPVEQYGSMKAETNLKDAFSMQTLYDMYKDYVGEKFPFKTVDDFSNYDKANGIGDTGNYDNQTVLISRNLDGTMELAMQYLIRNKENTMEGSTSGVLVGYNPNSIENESITIKSRLYQDYWVITNEFITAFTDAIKDEQFGLASKTTGSGYSTTVNLPASTDNPGTYPGNTETITLPSTVEISDNGNHGTASFPFSSSLNTYTVYNLANKLSELDFFEKYLPAYSGYATLKSAIESYNNQITGLQTRIENLKTSIAATDQVTDQMAEQFSAEYQEIKSENDNLKLQNIPEGFLLQGSDAMRQIGSMVNDYFCQRVLLYNYHDQNSYNLDGFQLTSVTDRYHFNEAGGADTKSVYVVQWVKTGDGTASYYDDLKATDRGDENRCAQVDENGYVFTGTVNIVGIGNEVFEGETDISNVTLSNQIEFIGNEAFKDCRALRSVSFKNCKAIGNEAFSGCTSLATLDFTGENTTEVGSSGSSKVAEIGKEAFYNTSSLRSVSFPNSITDIGPGAFTKSSISSIKIDPNTGDIRIWPYAFFDCIRLGNTGDGIVTDSFFPDETFTSNIVIGQGAFGVTSDPGNMKDFVFPQSMSSIIQTPDTFKVNGSISGFVDSNYHSLYEAHGNQSASVYFDDSEFMYDFILGGRNSLEHVTFPKRMGYATSSTATPVKIPDNTLMGCANLDYATMGMISYKEPFAAVMTYDSPDPLDTTGMTTHYDTDQDGETLFQDVTNDGFYVEGPGYISNESNYAKPRQATWTAQTNAAMYVPYKYLDATGKTCMEIAAGDSGEYLASVEVIDENLKTAKLVSFTPNGALDGYIRELIIPSKVGEYTITELGTGCFEEVKDRVYELTIQDGTIQTLEAGAFSGSTSLLQVNIGNSVNHIGEEAFRNCTKLENVYFSEPLNVTENSTEAEWANVLTIGDRAFATNSPYLTFHGAVHSGYEPFEHAMGENTIGSSRRNICYKTDNPMNLTIIRDNATGYATCIDYPHYEDIDKMNQPLINQIITEYQNNYLQQGLGEYTGPGTNGVKYSIIQKWEHINGFRTNKNYDGMQMLSDETDVVLNTLLMKIPNGVESTDSKRYFQQITDNNVNFDYLKRYYTESDATEPNCIAGRNDDTYLERHNVNYAQQAGNLQRLYSEDDAYSSVSHGGLFSGYFIDSNMKIEGDDIVGMVGSGTPFRYQNYNQNMIENVEAGNDNLLTMTMNSVKSIPDYAFESCENLLSVGIGTECEDIGKAPFRGDKNLTSITGNSHFTCDNGVLYAVGPSNNADYTLNTGEYRVIECLESRGGVAFSKSIPSGSGVADANWGNVVSIEEEAFAYCTDLSSVDFSDTKITEIPEGAFLGDTNLRYVSLPASVSSIDSQAFKNCTSIPDVYIYNPSCQIESDAFDDGGAIFYGYQYTDNSKTSLSPVYNYAQKHNITFHDLGTDFTVVFYDYDGTVIETQSVKEGTNAVLPDDPVRAGYDFTEWAWEKPDKSLVHGKDAYQNVNENRTIIAQYTITAGGGTTDGKSYNLTMVSGTANGSADNPLSVLSGSIVTITCAAPETGKRFAFWSADTSDTAPVTFTQQYMETTTFLMPTRDCTITANYVDSSTGGGGSGGDGTGGDGTGGDTTDDTKKYKLTVNYGSGSGEYKKGETVSITANAPESNSRVFSYWSTTTSDLSFASSTSVTTSITMPDKEATVTANYKVRSDDDDDDDDDDDRYRSDRDSTTSSTTTTTPGTNPSTATNPSTSTNSNNNTGNGSSGSSDNTDRLDISKDGISNKDVGSVTVNGSTDNFVVKITDTPEARSAVEQALTGKFGSLDGIAYFPMDIKLYDSTGNNQITDTSGLSVDITIPIPDELIQYGGNNKVGAVANNQMEELVPKFTTIDGIGCVTFTATHFSPYAVYVDTNNLVAGQMLDATPATGDGIHPKWFLVIGFACMSVVLFTLSNRKKILLTVK